MAAVEEFEFVGFGDEYDGGRRWGRGFYIYHPLRSRHGEHRDNINLKNRETTILEKYSSFRDRISQAI